MNKKQFLVYRKDPALCPGTVLALHGLSHPHKRAELVLDSTFKCCIAHGIKMLSAYLTVNNIEGTW